MTATRDSVTRTFDLLRRSETCLVCDTSKKLVCPDCATGFKCEFVYPKTCLECPRAFCVVDDGVTPTPTPKAASTNVGAIAGGVVGGLAVIAAITYLVWRFCIRTRRQPVSQEEWNEAEDTVDTEKTFAQRRDTRASTRQSVHSIASTVLTRASNIIQIAYIPGVTNRATASPTVLVPPVPPLPLTLSNANSPAPGDQHFFVPGDLRDSTYSALSGYSDRTSYARTSYAPRSSVASTIYGRNTVILAPAQTGMRAKPAMVSVKSAHSAGSTGTATPPVPSVDYEKYNGLRPPSPANSTFSVGSTFLNNASTHTATPARAMVVRVGSVKKVTAKPKTPEEPVPSTSANSLVTRDSGAATIIVDSPSPDQGPFSDPPKAQPNQSTTSLSAVIEEATRRASQRTSSVPAKDRGRSPFGDEHATQD